MKTQSGLSLIATILALLIFSLFIAVAVSLVTTGAHIGVQETQGQQAFDIAEGGLEKTLNYIIKQKDASCATSETCACTDAAAYANTNPSLGAGSFNVATTPALVTNPTTLNGSIIAESYTPSIPVTSDPRGVYATSGRIMIDREVIEYTSLTATTFEGCKRGVAGTDATAHYGPPVVTRVGQKQCAITSTGTIPNPLVSSIRRRVSTVAELQNGWSVGAVAPLPTNHLNSIYCTDSNNCWAMGNAGVIIKWNGTSWSDVTSPINRDLNSVFMVSSTDGWAVGIKSGNQPTMLRWNYTCTGASQNNQWNDCTGSAPATNEDLNSVFMLDTNSDGVADDGWAVGRKVGNQPSMLRWNKTCSGAPNLNAWSNCTSVAPATNEDLNSVSMVSATDGWAVGRKVGNQPSMLRWNSPVSNQWNNWTSSAPATNEDLNSVFMVSPTNGWAVGDSGTIIRWDGTSWSSYAPSPTNEVLNSVFMIDTNEDGVADNGWAVGNTGTIIRWDGISWSLWQQANATALRWNHASWSDRSGLLPIGINELNSVSMLSYADGWAVGRRIAGNATIVRWNGTNWVSVQPSPAVNQNLNSVFAISAMDTWAVGQGGVIIRWNGTSWSTVTSPTGNNLNSIFMLDTNNDSIADAGWAVGAGGVIIRWNGTIWSSVTSPTGQNLNSVFAISAMDTWAVGAGGVIIRWNGTIWSSVTSPTGQDLYSVYMVSATDGWAVGRRTGATTNGWVFLRWNGSTWSQVSVDTAPTIAQNLNSVFMLSYREGYAMGNNGAMFQWDGSAWSRLTAITGADLNELYILGTSVPKGQWREIFP